MFDVTDFEIQQKVTTCINVEHITFVIGYCVIFGDTSFIAFCSNMAHSDLRPVHTNNEKLISIQTNSFVICCFKCASSLNSFGVSLAVNVLIVHQ